MIDPTTLPVVKVGETLVEGQRFTIKGKRFDRWPEELVFEYTVTQTFQVGHVFNIFATPFDVPRAILEYDIIDTIG